MLVWITLGLPGCRRQSQPAPEVAYRSARLAFQRGELGTALNDADASLHRYEKRDPVWGYRFRVLKAEILMWRGQSKESLALLEQEPPASLASDEVAARRKMAQGLASSFLQKFDDAARYLQEAEQLAASKQPSLAGEVALDRGVFAILHGNSALADTSFRRALEIARQDKQPFLEANALSNLGLVYMRRQQYGEAINWFNTSRQLAESLGNRTLTSKVSGNLGWSFFKLGNYENALSLFNQSETLAAELGLERDRLAWLTNIGSVSYELRQFADAERYYKTALSLARKLDNKSAIAVCLNNLAATGLETGEYDLAEQYNREAQQLKRSIGDSSSELYSTLNDGRIAAGRKDYARASALLESVIRDSGENVSLRWEADADLANVYSAQGMTAKAEQHFRQAIATADEARASLVKEEYRLSFLTSATRFYNDYIDFLIERGRAREALQVAEHSRARTLAEGLGIDRSGTRFGAANFRPEEAAKKLNTVILSYWLKPGHSYLWVVTPAKVALFQLPADTEIDATVQAYRKAIVGPRDVLETANPQGQQLYDMLLAPARKLIPSGARVAIVPDGSLHGLNFETLLVPTPQLHYWIEDAVVTNASSIALLAASSKRPPTGAQRLLLFGDPISPAAEYPALTQAKLEMQEVQNHFAAEKRMVVAGEKATPRAYSESNPGNYSYIHFVAHGTASRISPLDSGVIVSRDGDTYKLYARDIMQQRLRAELVTISACYGAGTRAYSGEGLVGLSWAFLRAGAHHVIAALWEVNDASTPQLMDTLYSELQRRTDPVLALRAAKLAMLHSNGVYRRPFYWAAFQVYSGS